MESLWFPLLLLALVLIIFLRKPQNRKVPPGPPKLPIIGNLHQFGDLPHRSLWDLSTKYGPIMSFKIGSLFTFVVSSAETAKDVLKIHDIQTCSKHKFINTKRLSYNFLDISFSPYSDYWRDIKKLAILEVFSIKRVQSFRFIREDEVSLLLDAISQAASSSNPVNLTYQVFAYSASILFRIALGYNFRGSNLDEGNFHCLLHDISTVLGEFSAEDCIPYMGWIIDRINGNHAKLERVFHEMDTIFENAINVHLELERNNQQSKDIIDVMLELDVDNQDRSTGSFVQRNHIKGLLMNIFFGGIDTSSNIVIWAMAELIRNPRVMKIAQDEIRNCVRNRERVTEDDLYQLQYLKLLIKETLRLHPVAPLLVVREVMSHFKMNEYDIFPKDLIIINAWGIARDPSYWDKPEEFFPERFIENSIDFRGQHFEFLPFGSGRRICPGINMGLAAVELALANLLYCFNWEAPKGMENHDINLDEKGGITLSKKIPLELVPIAYFESRASV